MGAINFDQLQKAIGVKPELGKLGDIISSLVTYILIFAGFALLLYLIFGGFQIMTSSGDPAKMKEARAALTNAIAGFLIIFIAYWLVQAMGIIFGVADITRTFQ